MKHSLSLLLLCAAAIMQAAAPVKSSVLQTNIAPYLESQDTYVQLQSTNEQLATVEAELVSTQDELSATETLLESTQDELVGANSQIDEAELLLSGTAIPDAITIDTKIANMFSLNPCEPPYTLQCSFYNPNDPLVEQINNGLIPRLQHILANIGELNKITQVAAGANHTVILTSQGKVYATGDNTYGQLGIGSFGGTYDSFVPMIGAGESGVNNIAAGGNHTVVQKVGALYATGDNTYGQLGIGNNDNKNELTAMIGAGTSTTIFAAGTYHTVAKNGPFTFATGNNSSGQLGIGNNDNKNELTPMVNAGSTGVTALAAGNLHTVAVHNGVAYGTGDNFYGQLGIGTDGLGTNQNELTPMVNEGTSGVTAVAAGDNYTVVLKSGTAYGTGYNIEGQLGTGDNVNKNELTPMVNEGAIGVGSIVAGGKHTIALKSGTAFGTGDNFYGQLGLGPDGSGTNQNELTRMVNGFNIALSGIATVAAGLNYTIALQNRGTLCGTGQNNIGQLGLGYIVPNVNILSEAAGTFTGVYVFPHL